MKFFSHIFRNVLIVGLTVFLTTLVINAGDNFDNLSNSLIGSVLVSQKNLSSCKENMVEVKTEDGYFCIDIYEASPSNDCTYAEPEDQEDTRFNLTKSSCKAVSEEGRIPWTNIARHQAELACSNAGKRLPTNKEWYRASLGTPDSKASFDRGDCNINSNNNAGEETGSFSRCVSNVGTYDMIGNVWEWVGETVRDGRLHNENLPQEGYVKAIDESGVPLVTDKESDLNFNNDYFWVNPSGVNGMIRGGYSKSGTDGGVYTINTSIPVTFFGHALGFRCVL